MHTNRRYIDKAFEQVITYLLICVLQYISSRQIYFIVKFEVNKSKQASNYDYLFDL